jgi:hypothetical protein
MTNHIDKPKGNGAHEPDFLEQELAEAKRRIAALEAAILGPSAEHHNPVVGYHDHGNYYDPVVKRNSPFYGRQRAAEVYAIYTNAKTRHHVGTVLKQRGGADLWPLILDAIDGGVLAQTDLYTHHRSPASLRLLFPWMPPNNRYALEFDLANPRHRQMIRDDVLPIAIANKKAIMANPDLLERLVYDERQRRKNAVLNEKALASLKPDEAHVIMFGTRLWPQLDTKGGAYAYDQVVTAVCWFRHLNDCMTGDPHSRAIQIRQSTRWIADFVNRHVKDADLRWKLKQVFQLVHSASVALENSPSAECRVPPYPHID